MLENVLFSQILKSQDCILNHCLPMLGFFTIILEITGTNSNVFILNTKTFLEKFDSIFRIYMKFGTFFKKNWPSLLKYFGSYSLRKMWILESIGGLVSQHPLAVNVLTGPLPFRTLPNRTFIWRFSDSDIDRAWKQPF